MKNNNNKTTFEKFIENPSQRKKFEKEYNDFLISEFLSEAMSEKQMSVRKLSEKSGISTSIIQNLKTKNTSNLTIKTLNSLLNTLGYHIKIEKIEDPIRI
jgi:DNA-binding Xre family transcriptional regulator